MQNQSIPSKIEATRWAAAGALLALIALCLAWELWLAPIRAGGSWLALKALPLAWPLAGILKRRMYTYRWLSLALWLYFAEGLVRATSENGTSALLAWLEVILCLILFTCCVLHIRWRQKIAKSPTQNPKNPKTP